MAQRTVATITEFIPVEPRARPASPRPSNNTARVAPATAARAARINRKTLIGLEQGDIKEPSHRVLSGLARAYKCSIDDFFTEVAESTPAA